MIVRYINVHLIIIIIIIPLFLDALAQLFHVLDLALVNAVPQDPTYGVVHRV